MSNGGVPGPATGSAQTSTPAPVQAQPVIPAQGAQVGDPQQAGDSPKTYTSEEWQAFQSSADTRISTAEQRAQQAEQKAEQATLQAQVQSRASELYRWAAQQPDVDVNQLGEWALQTAQQEIGAYRQTEADKRDAEAYRQTRQQTSARQQLATFAQQTMTKYGLTVEEFGGAVGHVPTTARDFKEQVLHLAHEASLAKIASNRFQSATGMVNSTPFPGPGGATSANEDFTSPPPGAKPGSDVYGQWLIRKRAALSGGRG